jgi:hypothetical protein
MTQPDGPPPLPLDDDGLLPESLFAAALAAVGPAYTVFAQQGDARIDAAAWGRHARQFFAATVELTRPKRYVGTRAAPLTDAAHLRVVLPSGVAELHTVFLRPRTGDDLEAAERALGGGGLALLAKRCETVVLVPVDPAPDGALFVTALLASVLLGPVLSPDHATLMGARTARLAHEKLAVTPRA